MNKMLNTQEMISALADGQLDADDFARAVEAATQQPEARATWHAYHLIGDVLRSGELAAATPGSSFMHKLQARLQQEQVAGPMAMAFDAAPVVEAPFAAREPAANASSFRWKLLAGVASLAAVVATGWNLAGLGGANPQAELAQAAPSREAAVVAAQERPVMIRDARLDELLAAHRQSGGASALQMPSGFLRSATFEAPAR